MKSIKSLVLVLAMSFSFSARAQSFDWSNLFGGNFDFGNILGLLQGSGAIDDIGGGQLGDIGDISGILNGNGNVEDILFNAAYMYLSHSEYAPILMALNIHSGADLKKFLMGEQDGSNAEDIVNHLSFAYAQENPAFGDWLMKSGVKDIPTLRSFRNGRGQKYEKTLNQMALAQARADGDYQEWLDQLGIENLSDLQGILSGDGGNILEKLWPLAKAYLENSEYGQYIPLIESLLGLGGGDEIDINLPVEDEEEMEDEFEDVEPPVFDEGSFSGLSSDTIRSIQKAKNQRAPKGMTLLN